MKYRIPMFLALAVMMTGCANYASFQSADTVPEDEFRFGVGATYSQYEIDIGEETVDASVPALAFWGRYGVTEELELHGNVWLPLGASVGGKYQLLGGRHKEGLSLSLGGDVGYISVSSGEGESEVSTQLLDLYVPVYTGYRFSKGFAMYLTPKYILRTSIGDETELFHTPAATLGTAIGTDFEFLVEGTVAYDIVTENPAFTAGIGVSF